MTNRPEKTNPNDTEVCMKRIRLFTHPLAIWLMLGSVGFLAGVILAACPSTGIVCSAGLTRCALGCADFTSDVRNCGACGVACQSLQICQNSTCQCRPGSILCGGACVVTLSDAQNCGGCRNDGGVSCSPTQVCDQGQCRAQCTAPLVPCAQGCVDLQSDPVNCSQCGHLCLTGQGCHRGSCTYDVVAACFNTGQIVGIQAGSDIVSPLTSIGTAPQALATMRGTLLDADGLDRVLRQLRLSDVSVLTNTNPLGSSPNHIFVDDPYLYIVNSGDNTLLVLLRTGDPQAGDAGLPFSVPAGGQLNFGANTSPQSIAKLDGGSPGTNLYVALSGVGTERGGIAQVSVSDAGVPSLVGRFGFDSLNLMPFDGGVTYPRASGIVSHRGSIYVALSNLDAAYRPAGPAMLAKLDVGAPPTVTPIYLPNSCLNTYWLVSTGDVLYVSCGGRSQFDTDYHLVGIDSSGVVALSPDGGTISWSGSCPADGGCLGPAVTRFAVVNDRLYLGDQVGRIFVLQNVDGGFVERRGYDFVSGGPPISACPPSASGFSLVTDVIAVP
jgi:hypothetical protein